jgi:hypothetical protein
MGLALALIGGTIWSMLPQNGGQPDALTIILGLGLGAYFLATALWFPSMRYEMDDQTLTMRYGILVKERIPLDQIQQVTVQDLAFTLRAAMRFPGLALFTINYPNEGAVYMCATSAGNDVMILSTENGKYGITPEDETAFTAALTARVPQLRAAGDSTTPTTNTTTTTTTTTGDTPAGGDDEV